MLSMVPLVLSRVKYLHEIAAVEFTSRLASPYQVCLRSLTQIDGRPGQWYRRC